MLWSVICGGIAEGSCSLICWQLASYVDMKLVLMETKAYWKTTLICFKYSFMFLVDNR